MAVHNVIPACGLLTAKTFELADQQRFASFSGDFNPLHMNNAEARRTQAGALAVHGMHQLLWALDSLQEVVSPATGVRSVWVRFPQFLFVHERASLTLVRQEAEVLRLAITTKGIVVANIIVHLTPVIEARDELSLGAVEKHGTSEPTCLSLSFDEALKMSGSISAWSSTEQAREYFPRAAKLVGSIRVNAMATLSRLVGMMCPGLHSIFSALDISMTNEETPAPLRFSVSAHDRRFSHIEQSVSGAGIAGTVKAFMRRPPTVQGSLAKIAPLVRSQEFASTVALIVGASRGLGEVVAKLIAAGGGRVLATYCVGREECERVQREIEDWGGRCDVLAYDARRPAAEQLRLLPVQPTSLYYFATPKIFGRPSQVYDAARFEEFKQIYIDGFYDLCCCLPVKSGDQLFVVYPSSIAVETRPRNMTEYAMAKAAGELMCSDLSRCRPGLRIVSPRLPRLATDQTATIGDTGKDHPPVWEVLLPIVRRTEERLQSKL